MTFNFDCVFYYVSDLERAVSFYRDVLGLRLVSRDVVARFDIDGVMLELVPTQRSDQYGNANARLCLRVDHLNAARNDLLRLGVVSSEPSDKGHGLLASLHDLDGNEIWLWQYKRTAPGGASMWQ
jgi:catechol 2,3-dioxygenase-like lactoylglutathione lyase family enzyme